MLLIIKNVKFEIELEQVKRAINGIQLYDKLKDGWKITGYTFKE